MEGFVFIHGSSVGQSVFNPTEVYAIVANDIANKYFQGRTLRQKESSAKLALFVDLYQSADEGVFCIYSLVNNECWGANGREGQYFALSIACKGIYVYPEAIYRMLHSAYIQMLRTGKIISLNGESMVQYQIPQFDEEKEYLSVFLKKIEDAFYNITNGLGRAIDASIHIADYDSWKGIKVNIEICNSLAVYNRLCEVGRMYISDEYESLSQKIKILENKINKLQTSNLESEQQASEAKRTEKAKVQEDIARLNQIIKKNEADIQALSDENTRYKDTIEIVRSELSKYEKIGKTIHNIQEQKSKYRSKSKTDLLKICLLFIILFITLVSGLMNYAFFRGDSSFFTKNTETEKENTEKPDDKRQNESQTTQEKRTTYFEISSSTIEFDEKEGTQTINITTDGDWEAPKSPQDWVKMDKDINCLSINVRPNDSNDERRCIITVRSNTEGFEKQITISQRGKTNPYYGIIVTNQSGIQIQNGSRVENGETLHATVTYPNMANGFGWKYHNCSGQSSNFKEVNVTVNVQEGNEVVIAYGNLARNGYRERFFLKIKQNSTNPENSIESDSDSDTSVQP